MLKGGIQRGELWRNQDKRKQRLKALVSTKLRELELSTSLSKLCEVVIASTKALCNSVKVHGSQGESE